MSNWVLVLAATLLSLVASEIHTDRYVGDELHCIGGREFHAKYDYTITPYLKVFGTFSIFIHMFVYISMGGLLGCPFSTIPPPSSSTATEFKGYPFG